MQINVFIYSLQQKKKVHFIYLSYVAANQGGLFKISPEGVCPMENSISFFRFFIFKEF